MAKFIDQGAKIIILVLRIYQACVSPWLGQCCRFYPSCSTYAVDAIRSRGVVMGCCLTLNRLLRCHPWHQGGIDLVPEKIHYVNHGN